MRHAEATVSRAVITGYVPGDVPAVLMAKRVRRPDGKERLITQQIPVRDQDLWQRLIGHVRPGDEAELTVVTEWHDTGYCSNLVSFTRKVSTVAASKVPSK